MYKKALERAELESLNNPNTTRVDLDKIQSEIDKENAEALKTNALNAVCDAVVSAIETDKRYIGLYCFGKNAYSLVYPSEEELNSETYETEQLLNEAKGADGVSIQKLAVDSTLIGTCIEYLCEKQSSLPSNDTENAVITTLHNRYEAQLTVLENELFRLSESELQDSEQSL